MRGEVRFLDISLDGKWLVVGSIDCIVKIWDLENFWIFGEMGEVSFVFLWFEYDFKLLVWSICFGGDGFYLVIGIGGVGKGKIGLWKIDELKLMKLDERFINYGCFVDLYIEVGFLVVVYDGDKENFDMDLFLIDINMF